MVIVRLAWRNIWRHTRRTMITASAMAAGVAICLAYLAIADGMFLHIFDLMVSRQIGHVQIHHPEFPKKRALFDTIADGEAVESTVRALPEVHAMAARVYGYGLFAVGEKASGGQVTGIQPTNEDAMRGLSKFIVEGEYLSDKPEQKILLGYQLAETLKAKVGDELVVVTSAADGSMGNELYRISGLLNTGAIAIDKTGAIVHIEDAQTLLALEGKIHELSLLAEEKLVIPTMAEAVRAKLDEEQVLLRTWTEVNPLARDYLAMQDAAMLVIAVLVFGVAGLGIMNTMLMSVFERTRELGVLIALGLKPPKVLALIVLETFFITVIASVFGLVLGGLLDWWLVVSGIDFGAAIEMAGVRMDSTIHGVIRPVGIVGTVIMVFIISFFASLWPAARAARLKPVVAMSEQ